MEIEGVFETRVGLFLLPKFSIIDSNLGGNTLECACTVIPPDGTPYDTVLRFSVGHISTSELLDPIEEHWPITPWLPEMNSQQAPVGSIIMVDIETRDKLGSYWPAERERAQGDRPEGS